jgi:hypothetical protein
MRDEGALLYKTHPAVLFTIALKMTRYLALATTDFDGTLATNGQVFPETLDSFKRPNESERRLSPISA